MKYCVTSIVLTLISAYFGYLIPQKLIYAPVWLVWAFITGTIATGNWVIAHECGHNAFSDNKLLQDTVGYILHTCLLVPYFSWQRTHAIHHAHCNSVELGETHVPDLFDSIEAKSNFALREIIGEDSFAIFNSFVHLFIGWPAYIIIGATGGPAYGRPTNHFWPFAPFKNGKVELFPGKWKTMVLISDIGIFVFLYILNEWARATSYTHVALIYGLPYIVVNLWLVLYTWL
jgi:fatty acid desaturase